MRQLIQSLLEDTCLKTGFYTESSYQQKSGASRKRMVFRSPAAIEAISELRKEAAEKKL